MVKRRSGPRPRSVKAFAAIVLALACWNLATALFDLPGQEGFLRSLGLGFEWNRDWTIVASSAWFTIELIPIALVWFFASGFARWLVLAMASLKLLLLLSNPPLLYAVPGLLMGSLVTFGAIALLFSRDAAGWFNPAEEVDHDAFD